MPETIHISRLLHQGTPAAPSEVGTDDPSIWDHFLFIKGRWYAAVLKSDVIAAIPDRRALLAHFKEHPGHWQRMASNISSTDH